MFKTTLLSFALLALFGLSSADKCPTDIKLQENFDLSKYTGIWNEISRDKRASFQSGDCTQAKYTPNPDGTFVVRNS